MCLIKRLFRQLHHKSHVRAMLTIIFIVGCVGPTSSSPKEKVSSPDYLWLQISDDRSRVGKIDISNGKLDWYQVDASLKDIVAFSASTDGHYIAGLTEHGITVYKTFRSDQPFGPFSRSIKITGYENIQWAPDATELLLFSLDSQSIAIWSPQSDKLPSKIELPINDRVCGVEWGYDSNTIIAFICKGQRKIVSWVRDTKTLHTLLQFDVQTAYGYGVYANTIAWSPDRKQILLNLHLLSSKLKDSQDLPDVMIRGEQAILNISNGVLQLLDIGVMVGSSYGTWISDHELITIGQRKLTLPPKFDYLITDLNSGKTRSLLLEDQNCIEDLAVVQSTLITIYYRCDGGKLEGLYLLDLHTGKRQLLPMPSQNQRVTMMKMNR